MFKIGDQIVYPSQGVGIIDKIEKREFKGNEELFYTIHLLNNSLKLLLPENRMESSHIRLVTKKETLDNLLNNFSNFVEEDIETNNKNSKDRFEINKSKVKSGSLIDSMDVCFNLSKIKKEHPLNSSENQMFNNTKKVIIEEISLVMNITKNKANNILENAIFR